MYINHLLKHLICVLAILCLSACNGKILNPDKPVYVKIKTNMGSVTVMLYDDTPLHKENFIRLCREKSLEGLLFHRVIEGFVVQGGDPTSIEKIPGKRYGEDYGGYTVPAEILPHYFNKRGALIDAKESDAVNPERASAGTQFCFIQGRVLDDEELDLIEFRIKSIRQNWLYHKFSNRLKKENPKLAEEENKEELESRINSLIAYTLAMMEPVEISPERREVYKTMGGSPHLDGSVTIFGEVTKGLDIVEKISKLKTNNHDRPLYDVVIKSTKVYQK